MKGPVAALISVAPEDPEKKKEWATAMLRIQVAMWVDERTACAVCRRPYTSVDDFLARQPRAGDGFRAGLVDDSFVDDACWAAYEARKESR